MTTFGIKMNTQKAPTSDVNLRKAVAHAFDDLRCAVVGLRTDNFNFASQRAIEALGAKRDGVAGRGGDDDSRHALEPDLQPVGHVLPRQPPEPLAQPVVEARPGQLREHGRRERELDVDVTGALP